MGWTQVKPLKHPRFALAAATSAAPRMPLRIGGHTGPSELIYALGGLTLSTTGVPIATVATVEAFDVSLGQWSNLGDMPTARYFLAATPGSDGLHALGGVSSDNITVLATHEIFGPSQHGIFATYGWSPGPPMPTARAALAAVTGPDGLIYAIGGGGDHAGPLGTVEAYDPGTQTWNIDIKPMPTPRLGLAAVVGPDGLIYAIGGLGDHNVALDAVEVFNPATGEWSPGPTLPVATGTLAAAVGPSGLIYAIGGFDAGITPLSAVHSLDATQSEAFGWTPQPSLLAATAYLASATGPDGLVYAIGGASGPSPVTVSDVEAFSAPSPENACLDLVASLENMLADRPNGPIVTAQAGKAFDASLAACYRSGYLSQEQYDNALRVLDEINKTPVTPPSGTGTRGAPLGEVPRETV